MGGTAWTARGLAAVLAHTIGPFFVVLQVQEPPQHKLNLELPPPVPVGSDNNKSLLPSRTLSLILATEGERLREREWVVGGAACWEGA